MNGYPSGDSAGTFRYFHGLRAVCAALALTAMLGGAATSALAAGPGDRGPGDKGKGKGPTTEVQATGHPAGVHPEVKRFDVTGEGMPSVRGPFPDTVNMEWLGQVTNADMGLNRLVYTGASFLSDIWGWKSPNTDDEYAMFGTTSGMAFVRIPAPDANPYEPEFLGIVPTTNSGTQLNWWYDVKTHGNYAFWVTEVRNSGVAILDLTELDGLSEAEPGLELSFPANKFTRWGVDTGGGPEAGYVRAHNIAINPEEPYAYLIGITREGATYQNGIMILDISTPLSPSAVAGGLIEGEDVDSHDAQIVTYDGPDNEHDGKELLLNFNGLELDVEIWDVTNPATPTMLSEFDYSGSGFTHQGWFTEEQDFILVGDEEDELFGLSEPQNPDLPDTARTHICNARNLDAVVCNNSYDSDAASIDHNLFVKGDKVYQAHYTAGIRVLQINREIGGDELIESLSEIAHMDTEPRIPNKHLNWGYNIWVGPWGVYPFFDSGTIAASDGLNGLVLMRLDLP